VWADWRTRNRLPFAHGLGVEVEARDLSFGYRLDPKLRQDTLAAGVVYSWRRFPLFQPYAKFLPGRGSMDFRAIAPGVDHATRDLLIWGGGIEYSGWRKFRIRGDYEYQFWIHFLQEHHQHALNPQGFTVGVSYALDLGRRWKR